MRLYHRLAFVITFTAGCVLFAADAPTPSFKTRSALEAQSTFNGTSEKLLREYQEKMTIARRAYTASLKTAQAEATRAANLDDAVRIRDTIAQLQKESPVAAAPAKGTLLAAREALAQRLPGTVWEERGKQFRFNADGTMTLGDDSKTVWEWTAISPSEVIVRYPSGWTNTFKFDEKLSGFSTIEFGNGTKHNDDGKRLTK